MLGPELRRGLALKPRGGGDRGVAIRLGSLLDRLNIGAIIGGGTSRRGGPSALVDVVGEIESKELSMESWVRLWLSSPSGGVGHSK